MSTPNDAVEPEHEHLLDQELASVDSDEEDDVDDEEEGPDPFIDEEDEDDYDRSVREGWEGNIEKWNDL